MGTKQKKPTTTCMVCGGTGRLVLMRSWFPADGHTEAQCGICKGSGFSTYRDASYAKRQREIRAARTGEAA